jgi:hypothetical protein
MGENKLTLQLILTQRILVLVEIKKLLRDGLGGGLVFGIMVRIEIRMSEGVFDGDALDRVEGEELLQQIEGQVRCLGKHGLEGDLLLEGERADIFSRATGFDAVVILHGGGAEHVQDESQLMMI